MSKKANYRQIGLFVVGAVVLLVGAIVVFGSGKIFEDNLPAVLYFKESVKGLSVGAPVSYHGVSIGQVRSIDLLYQEQGDKLYIPVRIELTAGRAERLGADQEPLPSKADRKNFFRRMIEKGLRAQLAVDSFVTGQLFVDLDFQPDQPAQLVGLDGGELEIPTAPSGLEQLMGTIKKIPIDQIVGKAQAVLARLDQVLGDKAIGDVAKNANALLEETRTSFAAVSTKLETLLGNLDARVKDPELEKALKNVNLFLESGRSALDSVDGVVSKDSPVYYRLNVALEEIANAARSLQVLVDYIEQHPEAVLRGKS